VIAAVPACPPEWVCEFSPVKDPGPQLPWWEQSGGGVLVGVAIVGAIILLITLAYYVLEARKAKHNAQARIVEAKEKRLVEEQRTMQADAAKGDPEMLKLIRKTNA
jgi:uncharacterized protein HemX